MWQNSRPASEDRTQPTLQPHLLETHWLPPVTGLLDSSDPLQAPTSNTQTRPFSEHSLSVLRAECRTGPGDAAEAVRTAIPEG